MDGTFVETLHTKLSRPLELPDGVVAVPTGWALKDRSAVVEPGPKAAPLGVSTLGAVRDYLKANRDSLPLEKLSVHVVSPIQVRVLGPLDARARVREVFLDATSQDLSKDFAGTFRSHEDFMIGLQTRFADSGQRAEVMRFIGNVKGEQAKTSIDDGVTQEVTVRNGVALVKEANVPNPVNLAPYRTFRDVEQPASLFVLRVQGGRDGNPPTVGLFEADGGEWRLRAIDCIARWLSTALDDAIAVLS